MIGGVGANADCHWVAPRRQLQHWARQGGQVGCAGPRGPCHQAVDSSSLSSFPSCLSSSFPSSFSSLLQSPSSSAGRSTVRADCASDGSDESRAGLAGGAPVCCSADCSQGTAPDPRAAALIAHNGPPAAAALQWGRAASSSAGSSKGHGACACDEQDARAVAERVKKRRLGVRHDCHCLGHAGALEQRLELCALWLPASSCHAHDQRRHPHFLRMAIPDEVDDHLGRLGALARP